ncbi:MAG TPA: polysaccharide deacetylase family protein [Patescibacteria group bacterium]|jgi:peptidoglycan/xylan/chitin deacetylase (PgdA/CDA1 family)|nr:polysaccharide deacetylase family protein [Patescibacteria group bacterium]
MKINNRLPSDNLSEPKQPARRLRVSGLMPGLADRAQLAHHNQTTTSTRPRKSFASIRRIAGFIRSHHIHYYAAVTIVGLIILQLLLLGVNVVRGGEPILGLRFHGSNITNYDRTRLVTLVNQAIMQVERDPLSVEAGTSHVQLTARQLGARYSTNSVVAEIYSTGRSSSLWDQIVVQDQALVGQWDFRLGFPDINVSLTKDYLALVNSTIKKSPTNAYLSFVKDNLTVVAGQTGYELDIDGSLKALKNYDQTLDMRKIKLPLRDISPVLDQKSVSSLLPEAKHITDKPLKVIAGSQQGSISRAALTNLLTVENVPDPRHPTRNKATLVIDQSNSDKISAQLVRQFNHDAKARILDGNKVVADGSEGDALDGMQTKINLITAMVLRQQQIADFDKPLTLAIHHINAPILPKTPDLSLYSGSLSAYRGSSPRIILSFEDMPNATYGPQILDILKRNNIQAVFFVVGRNAISYPDIIRRIVNEGHIVGVSTYSYRDVAGLSGADLSNEIINSESAIAKITGNKPTLFRSPYGSRTSAADSVLASEKLTSFGWTLDALDWANLPSSFIANRVINNVQPGSIVQLHALNKQTAEALPAIISGLKKKGYVF